MAFDEELSENPAFQKLLRYIMDLRELSLALSRGDLQMFSYSKGFVISNLKGLQANLRHLTWQTKQVAEGDFSQRVEFLGDFSESFNSMTAKIKENNIELERLANVDFLTHVPNRRSVMQYLEQIFTLYRRSLRAFSVLMLDIDHFKQVNDTYGHEAGDQVLKTVCAALKGMFRESDMFGRIGGEEFIAILPETPVEGAIALAERARATMEDVRTDVGGVELQRTVSIGVAQSVPDDASFNEVIIRADRALYMAKNGGRNRVCA
ncbi:MAG: GGDEF domain-containing protein [Clostridiales Family XIII bacterium]|jgi:diguanylate cyclase (GGDEF)-like protein|nr:GGDEF domain-containing protein [Clostridiales Family XIII bacterium]